MLSGIGGRDEAFTVPTGRDDEAKHASSVDPRCAEAAPGARHRYP
jgi:hypothetical protein